MENKLRSLDNYKEMHRERAQKAGKWEQLRDCKTLTAARKIVFGEKHKKCRSGKES